VYFAGIPARAAPPIRRLFRLPFETDEGWLPLDDEGFSFPKTSTPYIPMTADRNQFPDMFEDWTNVALSANPMVHYYAVHLDIGWRVEIKLGDTWYEAIPRKECDISVAEREKAKNEVIKRWKKQMAENHARTKAAVLERVTDLPVRHNTRVVDRYELPDHQAETADAAERNTAEDGQGASQQQTSSGGSGTGGKKKPQIDWSDL
jgi:hypothetical protein